MALVCRCFFTLRCLVSFRPMRFAVLLVLVTKLGALLYWLIPGHFLANNLHLHRKSNAMFRFNRAISTLALQLKAQPLISSLSYRLVLSWFIAFEHWISMIVCTDEKQLVSF